MSLCRKGLIAVLVLGLVLLISSPNAFAAYLYPWPATPSIIDTDPPGNPGYAGQDITAAWSAFDGTYHYFRMDLAAAPSPVFPPGFAPIYGFYIDSITGVGAPSTNQYIPGNLTGIDFIVSTQFELDKHDLSVLEWDPELQVWKNGRFHNNEGSDPEFQWNGATLEWKIADNYQGNENNNKFIGNQYTWWAATLAPGDSPAITYDITDPVVVPIPNAAWLLGSGIIALVGLRRRKTIKG